MRLSSAPSADALPKGKLLSLSAIWRYLRPYRAGVMAATIALLLTSSGVLGMGYALRYLVDEGIAKGNPQLLGVGYVILLAVAVLLALATFARYYFVSSVGEKVVADIRRDVFAHLLSMHTGYFESVRVGDLLARITTDTTLLQNVVGSSISIFLRNCLLFIGGMGMLLFTSARLTEYVMLMLPFVIIPIIVLGKHVRILSRKTQEKVGDITVHAEETIHGIRTIHAMAMEDFESERFGTIVEDAKAIAMRRITMRGALTAIVIMLILGAIISVLYIGGQDVVAGRISAGELSAFIFYAVIVATALGAISAVIGELMRAAGAAERVFELLSLQPAIKAPAIPHVFSTKPKGRISFEHITFCYPTRADTPALNNLSFRVEPGETLAIVGPSGAGKTTIFQLILRFYDPQFGIVRVDSVDVKHLDPKQWRGFIGLVPQDPVIFSTSIYDNIRAGMPDADEAAIISAAKNAQALEFIESLPHGFHTHVGEKGVQLSGGQRQRIAIARALIRKPALLLLDEATSALDSANERAIQSALEAIGGQCTTMIIAHRLSTVQNANRILVLDQGNLQAIGTHAELLANNPLYQKLARQQFSTDS
jgi:ATP-binding cassette subfamily B protein